MKWMFNTKEYWMSNSGLAAVIVICIILFSCGYSLTWLFKVPNEAGDAAGLVNGFFSALAFACVIYAIFIQKHELELQREELAETRKELEGQKLEFKTQNETLKRQRFENTFFNMLQLQQQITDNITYSYRSNKENFGWDRGLDVPHFSEVKVECKGREVFRTSFEEAPHYVNDELDVYGMRGLLKERGLDGYEDSFTPTYFDHYFRHLYRIFKFVAESPLIERDEDRYEYASMARAQLSRYELIWLYYNALSSYGRDKFKPLIERFAILKNLREDMLVKNLNLDISYKLEAFEPTK